MFGPRRFEPQVTVEVSVLSVRYPAAPKDGLLPPPKTWYILATDKGPAKGEMAWRPAAGERLKLTGRWGVWHGQREFSFASAAPDIPIDQRDALHYAAERTSGIGPALEEAIWEARGEDWRETAAGEIKRLDGDLYLRFRETVATLAREAEKSQVIAWILGLGGTVNVATLAWERWELSTQAILSGDPYRIDELPGYGFAYADRIMRKHFAIADDDPRRLRAAIRYVMVQCTERGHSAVDWDQLQRDAMALLGGAYVEAIVDTVAAMFDAGHLTPWVSSHRISMPADADSARVIWEFATSDRSAAVSTDDAAAGEPPTVKGVTLDASQIDAINHACASRLAIITGGAGTGKTTIIRGVAGRVKNPTLCAFAGKAAARLREASGMAASTIHRLLQYDGHGFRCSSLAGQTIIIDEASMLDESLLAEVLRRRPESVILVGDEAQLPPVGSGQPFHDLIAIRPALVRSLTTCYRQTEAVFRAASAIRTGAMPPHHLASAAERWDILPVGTPERAEDAIVERVRDGLSDGSWDFSRDIILTPRNGDGDDPAACTVKRLNRVLRDIANPEHGEARVDIGDRVICTKNLPALDCWNGTTGTVHAIDTDKNVIVHTDLPVIGASGLPEEFATFDREDKANLQLAYALTVHKAQGSQYRNVVFAALARDSFALLDRSLVYTAVTRTRSTCTVVGHVNALQAALQAVRPRNTALQEVAKLSVQEDN